MNSHKKYAPTLAPTLAPILAFVIALCSASVATMAQAQPVESAGTVPTDVLYHIHGLSIASSKPTKIYLATHNGLFMASPDGQSVRIGKLEDDMMGYVAHPNAPKTLFASGHTASGGNMGVVKSTDGGKTWDKISNDGNAGSVDFHSMAISRVDANVLYGNYKGVQVSRDGGKTWKAASPPAGKIIGMAASSMDKDRVYAATTEGLFFSTDAATTWKQGYMLLKPATTVHAAADGTLYAFIYGIGLVVAKEPSFAWKTVSKDFADRYLLNLTTDASDSKRLYAATDTGAVMTSNDGGVTWISFEGSHKNTPEIIAKGKNLYAENCQECHGVGAIGESPDDMYAEDEFGFKAPALNNDAHAWHHSDKNIMESIQNGSDRNERMIPWKDQLSTDEIQSIISYIKSLWSFRSLACQGGRHMGCMKH